MQINQYEKSSTDPSPGLFQVCDGPDLRPQLERVVRLTWGDIVAPICESKIPFHCGLLFGSQIAQKLPNNVLTCAV